MEDEVTTKLSAARTRLVLDKPFLGALVLRLPMIAADPGWCVTTATDARSFYYNPAYVRALSVTETQFILAHEALHCALTHFLRRQHRVRQRWDVACDLAVNPLLASEGLKPPPGALLLDEFRGMTAEEIYPCLDENDHQETLDQHLYDGARVQSRQKQDQQEQDKDPESGGAAQPPPLGDTEREALGVKWQQNLAGAAQLAMQAGKLGGDMARLVDHLLQPQLPWRMLLARYLSHNARDDYSWMRPSRREGSALFPSLRSSQIELAVAVDTSGSISALDMAGFLGEVNALKGQLRARVTLLACDAALVPGSPWTFEPWEELKLPDDMKGGGGTRFTPVFEWLARQDRAPDVLVYFTDARGEFPKPALYPVLWLIKGREKVPFGQRIQLN